VPLPGGGPIQWNAELAGTSGRAGVHGLEPMPLRCNQSAPCLWVSGSALAVMRPQFQRYADRRPGRPIRLSGCESHAVADTGECPGLTVPQEAERHYEAVHRPSDRELLRMASADVMGCESYDPPDRREVPLTRSSLSQCALTRRTSATEFAVVTAGANGLKRAIVFKSEIAIPPPVIQSPAVKGYAPHRVPRASDERSRTR
jgi:hypothetical protein